jgi:iron-sulfur cluster repair protein YtfE (RIC family)
MLVSLRPRPVAEAPVGPAQLLLDCHGRIRNFTALAQRLATAHASPPDQIREAAVGVRRYFMVALPLHAEDEERSLTPRLLAAGASAELKDALAAIASQHLAIDVTLAALDPLWKALAQEPTQLATHASALAEQAALLEAQWQEHLPLEESVIFPAIAQLLDAAAQQAIVGEMAARRPVTAHLPPL